VTDNNNKKPTIIRHLSPPPPHRDTEDDKEEAATTGDGDDDEEEEDEDEADMYVPETETGVVEGEPHRDEPELGVSNETQPTRDDEETDVETNVVKGRGSLDNVAGTSDHVAEEGD
jgi:hypothetical protein